MNLRRFVFVAPLFSFAVFVGCIVGDLGGGSDEKHRGSDSQPTGEPCADDPFKCKAGTTCWPASAESASCVPSKSYKSKGSDCELLFGRSSCADGLVCITVNRPLDAGPDTGKDVGIVPTSEPLSICAPWCNDQHPCPSGEECRALSFEGFAGRACVPSNLSPPDTGAPDTAPADTNRPDTFRPDSGPDTTVTDSATDADDTATPDTTAPDTTPADTGSPDTGPPAEDTAPPEDTGD